MQYMLQLIADETKPIPSGTDLAKLMQAYGEFTRDIISSGHFRAGERLQPSPTAKTVREKDGKLHVIDGPATSGNQHIAGYYLVECQSEEEAIAIASRIPGVRLGEAVEIRLIIPTPTERGPAVAHDPFNLRS